MKTGHPGQCTEWSTRYCLRKWILSPYPMLRQGRQTWAQGGTQNITFPQVGNGGQGNQYMQRSVVQKGTECSRSIEWFCVAGVMGNQRVCRAQQAQGLKYQHHSWGPGSTWQGAGTSRPALWLWAERLSSAQEARLTTHCCL